jgi:hypothetical protein
MSSIRGHFFINFLPFSDWILISFYTLLMDQIKSLFLNQDIKFIGEEILMHQ